MKVLSFSYCFPNASRPAWGVFVLHRAAAVARRVESLEVAAPVPAFFGLRRDGRGVPGRETVAGLIVHHPRFLCVPRVLKSHDARLYARGLRGWLRERLRERPADVLDAHFAWPDGVGVARLAGDAGLPYVITLRGKIYPCLEVASQRRQVAEALRGAAAVVSVSRTMADVAAELGADAERTHVIPNGVDLDVFRPGDRAEARRALGLRVGGRLLVTVAHLGLRKGHGEVLQALARLPDDVRLVIVGGDGSGGRDERRLRRLIEELDLNGRVILAGPQPHERVPLYYNAADVGVLASWREGCPNTVLECLACGRPVVATNVGAVPDLIQPGRGGEIVAPRDAKALGSAVCAALERSPDPEDVRNQPAVRSWDEVAAEVVDVLAAAADRGARRGEAGP